MDLLLLDNITSSDESDSGSTSLLAAPAETYQIPQLGFFENGTFVFSSLRTFLSYITPNDVPVGM